MAYSDVDVAFASADAPGGLKGRIRIAMIREALVSDLTKSTDPAREMAIVKAVLFGSVPDAWVLAVLNRLDSQNVVLAEADDAQVLAAVRWVYRRLIEVA